MDNKETKQKLKKINTKQINVIEFEKERIITDSSNDHSPGLNQISNIMSPNTVLQTSLNFLQSDVSSIQESSLKVKRKSDENIITKTFTKDDGKLIWTFDFPSYITGLMIRNAFISLVESKNFDIVEKDNTHCLAIYKEKVSFFDLVWKCIPWKQSNEYIAIKLNITSDKITHKRQAKVKILQSNYSKPKIFLDDFKKILGNLEKKNIPTNEPVKNDGIILNSKDYKNFEDEEESDAPSHRMILQTTLESYSYYYFYKILTSENYSIGKRVSEFIKDFLQNYRSVKESADLLPQPMESVLILINEIINILFSDFNYGKSETKHMMPFARKSVEKYLFSKLYGNLISMYQEKYKDENEKFLEKSKVFRTYSFLKLFKSLEINKKFWLTDSEFLNIAEESDILNETMKSPYENSIKELNKLNNIETPFEKLTIILMTSSMMKTAVVDYHKGKLELCAMDDELPIVIYIVSQCTVNHLFAELSFVEDYIRFIPEYESEQRLITNLKVSIQYIINEWKI